MSTLLDLSIAELGKGYREKQFSAVDVTRAHLERIEANTNLNSFLTVTRDRALEDAKKADARIAAGDTAPLLGVPAALKDNIVTKGIPTTCASRMLEGFIPPYDATVAIRLANEGTVLLGKTNMDEFAMGSSNENSHFGVVRNPWNPEYVPGGSSGGSAAIVAAGLSTIALGTDTGGSIRQPASFCGVVGLKPTYGRVSRYGIVAFASSLDQVGPFGRTVEDCARVTTALCGKDPLDSTSVSQPVPDFTSFRTERLDGVRIGIPDEYFVPGLSQEVRESIEKSIEKLTELGGIPVRVSLPHTEQALSVYYVIAPAEASSNLARFDGVRYGYRAPESKDLSSLYMDSRAQGFGSEVKRRIMIGTYVLSTGFYDAYYVKAQKLRTLIKQDFTKAFEQDCDVILSPTAPTPPFRIGAKVTDPLEMYLSDVFTIPQNLAGLPAMSLPCGFSTEGLPIGLQLVGKPWDEATLFKVAFAYENATEWHKRRPAQPA